jgi:hypothetical protein
MGIWLPIGGRVRSSASTREPKKEKKKKREPGSPALEEASRLGISFVEEVAVVSWWHSVSE